MSTNVEPGSKDSLPRHRRRGPVEAQQSVAATAPSITFLGIDAEAPLKLDPEQRHGAPQRPFLGLDAEAPVKPGHDARLGGTRPPHPRPPRRGPGGAARTV